ncbi:MAG: 50S ribosomal protein L18, partial [Anaerolineales bacterium]
YTLISASSIDGELRSQMKGLDKSKQAQLVGKTIAERAKSKGIKAVVFDRGGFRYMGRVKALADGAREGGLEF